MGPRELLGAGVAVGALLVGSVAAAWFGAATTVPTAVACGGAVGVLVTGRRELFPTVGAAAGAASITSSVVLLTAVPSYDPADGTVTVWGLGEVLGLLTLTVGSARAMPTRRAVVGGFLAAAAVPAWLLRFGWGPVTVATLGGWGAWTLVTLAAVGVGRYLHSLDVRQARSVSDARREQRLQLARDVHDFVAHDVGGMVAQAQAGQILAGEDPAAAEAFRRIEQAGQRALGSMDSAVTVLRGGEGVAAGAGTPTLADLGAVVDRFRDQVDADVRLDVDLGRGQSVAPPDDLLAAAHRVVVEGLTNVRRHAPTARTVAVRVSRRRDRLPGVVVTVEDDGGPARRDEPRSGHGLTGLAEVVGALGGAIEAGPVPGGGWRLQAVLPRPRPGSR